MVVDAQGTDSRYFVKDVMLRFVQVAEVSLTPDSAAGSKLLSFVYTRLSRARRGLTCLFIPIVHAPFSLLCVKHPMGLEAPDFGSWVV